MKKNIFHELVTINENISLKYINLAFSDKIMIIFAVIDDF